MVGPDSRNLDIFCKVIDNYGDAGVSWRLARQLATEYALEVRLFIDEPAALLWLQADVRLGEVWRSGASSAGVVVRAWSDALHASPAACVIEAFGAEPPAPYLARMVESKKAGRPPVWIVLEYLSAEAWVDQVHGLASPHPRLPLVRHFFVPGFSPASGGLLCEGNLLELIGSSPGEPRATPRLFAFTYPEAPVALIARVLEAYVDWAAPLTTLPQSGRALAVIPQTEFDRHLQGYDLLLVRGEDSFVRAQLVGKPLFWHIYPTQDRAHLRKLDAWLEHYTAGMEPETARQYRRLSHAFVSPSAEHDADYWQALRELLPSLQKHARLWQAELLSRQSLAERLMRFVEQRAKQESSL